MALMDTGASRSIIKEENISKMKLKKLELKAPIIVTYADGRENYLTHYVYLKFQFEEINGAVNKTKTLISNKLNYDVILGNDFFRVAGVVFNYKDSYIAVDRYQVHKKGMTSLEHHSQKK